MTRYSHIARAVLSRPWAIRRDSVEWAAVIEVLESRVSGNRFSDEEIRARLAAGPQRSQMAVAGDEEERVIDVLPVHGVIMPRANLMMDYSGGTSVSQLSAAFRASVQDDRVQAIVLDFDSPGGMVDGVPEFGEQIRAARGTKPIYAVADTMAASAAYWLASQADEVAITPSGEVGSIGVFTAHDDMSKFYSDLGLERTFITYGENKAQANEYEPLGDHARERMQATVDYFGEMFDDAVAKGRGVTRSVVRDTFGQGDMFPAAEALALGMVDSIETLGSVLERAAAVAQQGRRGQSALGGARPFAVAIPVPDVDESTADEAVTAATEDAQPDEETRSEIAALLDRVALRPYQRRQRGAGRP